MGDPRRARNRRYILEKRAKTKCIGCPTGRGITYHHRNPKEKSFNISEAARLKVSIERLDIELVKCDALCEECHRLEHENRIRVPWGFSPEEFSVSTLTDDTITVIIVYAPSQTAYIGCHPTSRRLAHDQAFELFMNDI